MGGLHKTCSHWTYVQGFSPGCDEGLSDTGSRTSKLITQVHHERASPTAPGQGVKTLLVPMVARATAWRQDCPWLSPRLGVKTLHDNASHPCVPGST